MSLFALLTTGEHARGVKFVNESCCMFICKAWSEHRLFEDTSFLIRCIRKECLKGPIVIVIFTESEFFHKHIIDILVVDETFADLWHCSEQD